MKLLKNAMVIAITVSMLATAFAALPAKAIDVPNDWFLPVPNTPAGNFQDVAWTPDGSLALYVGDAAGGGLAYWYDPAKTGPAAWEDAGAGGMPPLKEVCWDYSTGNFFVIGDTGTSGGYWATVSPLWTSNVATSSDVLIEKIIFEDLVYNPNDSCIYAAGRDTDVAGLTDGACLWKWDHVIWTQIDNQHSAYPNGIWYGIAMGGAGLYLVGSDGGGPASGLYYVYSGGMSPIGSPVVNCAFSDIVFDTRPAHDWMLITAMNRGIGTPALYYAKYGGSYYNNLAPLSTSIPQAYNLVAMDQEPVSKNAIIVGNDGSGNGLIYEVRTPASQTFPSKPMKRTDSDMTSPIRSIAIRPTGAAMALLAGSSFRYSYMQVDGTIQINTLYPHIRYVDLYHANNFGVSVMNSQIDVVPDNSDYYTLRADGYYNIGASAIDRVDVYMWRDDGVTEIIPAGFDTAGFENTRIHLEWVSGAGFAMIYPGVVEETSIAIASCTAMVGIAGGLATDNDWRFDFAFTPHEQVRYAPGDGTWSAGTGTAPGYYNGPSLEQQSSAALDDLNSWNIQVDIEDTGAATTSAYDEFGIYMFTSLQTTGTPGDGFVSGAGAPGSTITLSPVDDVVYSVNCPYDLRVWTTDLVNPTATFTIFAPSLGIRGGEIGAAVPFIGAGEVNAQYLLGAVGSALPTDREQPLASLRTTSTTSGAGDGTGGGLQVTWSCAIPGGLPEDMFIGTTTYSLTTDP
jgi:hypothetical protein